MTHRLPVPLTQFFGRHAEIAQLQDVIDRVRMLTLVGAPGGGKTRLGVELSAQLEPRFADGVCFAGLAPTTDPALVASAVAVACGVHEEPGRAMHDTLVSALSEAELLVVLDNCEHVVAAAADVAYRLVVACPSVRVLATSRVALGVPGEQVYQVPPLDMAPAVELFDDRASLVAGEVPASRADGAAVEQICRRLDGLPLAIELTAAWTRVLSPNQIVDRLDSALPLLTASGEGAQARHETIEATVDRSYQLLRPAEQRMFDRLSVFAGGFDLDAAAAVASEPKREPDSDPGSDDALVLLTALVDHSLVRAEPHASATAMRYRLLEPVRQCGDAKLVARGWRDKARRRHAEHYLDVARRCDAQLRGPQRARALHRLEIDESNLLAALDWAASQRAPELGLRLCTALGQFWELQGRVNDGRARLDHLLQRDISDRRLRATALARAGRLAWRQGAYDPARALLEESLAILRELGDQLGVARRLRSLGLVAMSDGDVKTAIRLCEQSSDVFRAHDDEHGLVWALIFLGWAQYIAGDVDAADQHMRDALAANRSAGSVAATVNGLLGLVFGATRAGDVTRQRAHLVEALTAMRQEGGVVGEPDWLWAGTGLAIAEGRVEAALRLAGGAEALRQRGGARLPEHFIPPLDEVVDHAGRTIGRFIPSVEDLVDPAGRTMRPAMVARLKAEGARMTLDQLMAEAVAEPPTTDDHPLTPREREVVDLVADGMTNVEIAARLFISKRTVESHVDHIKRKLGVASRNHVMAWAVRNRIP